MKALFYPEHDFKSLMIPWIYREIYMDNCYAVLDDTKDLTILDIGANIGMVSDYMRPHAKKIYAVEPAPDAFEALVQNASFNHWDNVEMFNVAIANIDGEMEMTVPAANKTMGSLIVGERYFPPDKPSDWPEMYMIRDGRFVQPIGPVVRTKTKTKRLDTFMHENKIEKVDFMKLDVEGAEDMILRGDGFLNVAARILCIEMEFHYPDWVDLLVFLVNLGYKAHRVKTEGDVYIFNR